MASGKSIVLNDMSLCLPAKALSSRPERGRWQTVPYETDEVSGTMVIARSETGAPEITLPLKARGWHAVHLGFMGATWAGRPLLRVKLSGDPCFVRLETDADSRHLEEGFWKVADLTGQDLVIARQTIFFGEHRPASLAYVRLVPLAEEDVRRCQDRSRTRRLIAMDDGNGLFASGTFSAQDIQQEIEPYRNTDFGKISVEMWEGDRAQYPTRVGVLWGEGAEDFPHPIYRHIAEGARGMKERGINALQVALEHAHRIGLEFYAGMRFLFGMYPPADVFEGPFLRNRRNLCCRDYDGTEVSHPSFAFPEVRNYVQSLLAETASYNVDGLNLIFLRGQPFVLYEKPVVEAFRRETGLDPATLREKDARWKWYEDVLMPTFWYGDRPAMEEVAKQRVISLSDLSAPVQQWLRSRATAMTEFIRGLRKMLDKQGKKQKLSAVVYANEADNFFYGLNVEAWIKEKLVDLIIPYPWPEYFELDMEYFERITEASKCEMYPIVVPRQQPPKEYLRKAQHYYEHGVDGLAFWDCNGRYPLLNQWQAVRELGHKDELKNWLESDRFPQRFSLLRRVGDYTVDRYWPGSGG